MIKEDAQKLSKQILFAILAGIIIGLMFNLLLNKGPVYGFIVGGLMDIGGKVFINLLKMLVVPVVLISLVCGSFSINNGSRFGLIALKTVSLYIITTAIAIILAIVVSYLFHIGVNDISLQQQPVNEEINKVVTIKDTLLNIFPSNPIKAMAKGNMLQIIVFALLLGLSISAAGEKSKKIRQLFTEADIVVMHLVHIVFRVAPFGVFCLVGHMFAELGIKLLSHLTGYFFTVILVLACQLTLVYSSLLKLLSGLSPRIFLNKMRTAMLFAFSTSSSNASIPIVLETTEKKLGVDEATAAFVIPLGATINMDGTTIMQGVATLFIANSYHIILSMSDYLSIVLLAILASIGTAGIPGIGLVTLTMVLTQVGIPVEGIGLIIGIDRLLDMLRTSVNVCGDAAVACIVSHSEGTLELKQFNKLEH